MQALLVDDLPLNRKLLRVIFSAEGHAVFDASDGLEALQVLRTHPIDIVVSDILMPNMDGYALCRAVRQDPVFSEVPFVIYTSTYVSPGDRTFALECGADAYLLKPAPADELLATVAQAIDARKSRVRSRTGVVEETFLKKYNEVLIRKLEDKNVELRRRTEELMASEEIFRGLVENLQQVFFVAGPGGKPMNYVSPSYETIWGRSCASVYKDPTSWLQAVVPEDRPRVEAALGHSQHGFSLEFRIETPDNGTRWIRIRAAPIPATEWSRLGLRGLAEDITPLKQVELQFHEAQKMEGIGRLAGGVAHDFNNLLTAIVGFNSLALLRTPADHPARRDLNQIDALVKRAAQLTGQLLAFSRRQMFEPKVIDVNKLITGMKSMLGPLLGEDIQLMVVEDPQLGKVRVDPGQFEQVIMNLCINARDAMPQGGHITIVTRGANLEAGEGVEIVVSDSGEGIAPEVLPKIFEPFFTTKGLGRGTGLGLATCYGIVKQSGGNIRVQSSVGEGSSFHILLPRSYEMPGPDFIEPLAETPAGGSETLLVIEDDPHVSQVTSRLLQASGYTVLLAQTPDEAMDRVENDRKKKIRLVLTDIVMPGQNGKELADRILSKRPDLKVIFTSGYTDDAILRRGIEESEVNFLRKPFTPSALTAKVREVLDREGMR